jgi:hypothetical protein
VRATVDLAPLAFVTQPKSQTGVRSRTRQFYRARRRFFGNSWPARGEAPVSWAGQQYHSGYSKIFRTLQRKPCTTPSSAGGQECRNQRPALLTSGWLGRPGAREFHDGMQETPPSQALTGVGRRIRPEHVRDHFMAATEVEFVHLNASPGL